MLLTEQRGQTRALQALSKDVWQMSRTMRRDSGQLVCAVNGLVRAITQLSRHQQETNSCLKAIAASIAGGVKEDHNMLQHLRHPYPHQPIHGAHELA